MLFSTQTPYFSQTSDPASEARMKGSSCFFLNLSCDATEYRQKNAARHFRHAASAINELWLLQLALHFLGKIEVFLDHL